MEKVITADFVKIVREAETMIAHAAARLQVGITSIERECPYADNESLKIAVGMLEAVRIDLCLQWAALYDARTFNDL
jgi:hypothetical protein